MKKTIKVLFILFAPIINFAQYNLVPNCSFENYSSCPTTGGQLYLATNWITPCLWGSPDYYNSCATLPNVPLCGGGTDCFQYAKNGNAYAGLYTYDATPQLNLREYIQAELISPLINGNCYYVGFYANNADWAGFATNKLGAYLSQNAIANPGGSFILNCNSQIKSYNNKIIKDTLNWEFIGGIFQASNSEKYITIGNFNTDATTDTLTYNYNALAPLYAYYFIDSVFVIPVDSMPNSMHAFAGNDITINSGDSTFIGQEISNLNCNWYQGASLIASNISGIYVKPLVTTTYFVHQTLCGNTTTDTVVVTVNPSVGIYDLFIKDEDFIISPNPNNGFLNIELSNKDFKKQNITIKLFTIFGREIKEIKLQENKEKIDIQDLDNGIYYLQYLRGNKVEATRKIIKQ